MGVRTKDFGPYAWRVLEAMANQYDEMPSTRLRYVFGQFLYLLGFLLPCVFCRVSYREFISGLNPNTDISSMLKLNRAKLLIYNLHECVNEKLYQQSLEQPSPKPRVRLDFSEVKFGTTETKCFWEAFLIFMGYVMCDYRESIRHYLIDFITCIQEFLTLTDSYYVTAFNEGLHRVTFQWDKLESRLRDIWFMFQPLTKYWQFDIDETRFRNICQQGIVTKCVK